MVHGRVREMGKGTWIPLLSVRKPCPEKTRLGYIYSAYNTGSRIFLAFSVRVQSLYNGGLRLTLEHAKWLIANNFFKRSFNFE